MRKVVFNGTTPSGFHAFDVEQHLDTGYLTILRPKPEIVIIFATTVVDGVLKVILVKQYRHGIDGECIELPAGINDKPVDLETIAREELLEETGYICEDMELLCKIPMPKSPGLTNEEAHLFYAPNCIPNGPGGGVPEEGENIEVILVDYCDFIRTMVNYGESVAQGVYSGWAIVEELKCPDDLFATKYQIN